MLPQSPLRRPISPRLPTTVTFLWKDRDHAENHVVHLSCSSSHTANYGHHRVPFILIIVTSHATLSILHDHRFQFEILKNRMMNNALWLLNSSNILSTMIKELLWFLLNLLNVLLQRFDTIEKTDNNGGSAHYDFDNMINWCEGNKENLSFEIFIKQYPFTEKNFAYTKYINVLSKLSNGAKLKKLFDAWKKTQASAEFWNREQLKNARFTTTAQLQEAVTRTMGDISAVEAGRLSEIYERTTADAHLEGVNDKHEGPARMDSAQEEQVMHEPNVEREGVVMILEGEEIRADSQYNIHNWMYNKLLNKQYTIPERPRTIPEDKARSLELMAYDLIMNLDIKKINDSCILSLSYIINTLNDTMANRFKQVINDDSIWETLKEPGSLPSVDDEMVSELFQSVCKFITPPEEDEEDEYDDDDKLFKSDKKAALIELSQRRITELRTTNNQAVLEVIEILDYVINNVDSWRNMDNGKTSEADFILAINPIFNILFRDNNNLETQADVYNVDTGKAVSGRKIDVMVISENTRISLCAIEWKKKNASAKRLLIQQTKNLRVNKCHLAKILKLQLSNAQKKKMMVVGMDWKGFDGYMFTIRKVDGVYVANLLDQLSLPRHLETEYLIKTERIISIAMSIHESLNSFEEVLTRCLKRQRSASDLVYMSPKRRGSLASTTTDNEYDDEDED
ncbi:hypothetical protein BDC45DRAFT_585732 [Circinella umbellata]|nr:hypothetical protein BDC45DRAFT_585732 [Circinella umbellata]